MQDMHIEARNVLSVSTTCLVLARTSLRVIKLAKRRKRKRSMVSDLDSRVSNTIGGYSSRVGKEMS